MTHDQLGRTTARSGVGPLTAEVSRDDVVRRNNGGFFALASEY